MTRRILIALVLALPLLGCADEGPQTPAPPDPAAQMPALENRIAALTEEQRLKIDPKAKPLALDPELARVARERAADMASKNYLAHAAPNGDTSASLLMAEDEKFQGLLGENLAAQHYVKQSGVDVEAFAQRFLDEWLKSQPHRDNLAFSDYELTGVGAAVNGDTVYVAQLFAFHLGNQAARDPSSGATEFPSAEAARSSAPPPADALRLRGAEGGPPAGAGANPAP